MSEDRSALIARLEKARAARVGPKDEHRWSCPKRDEQYPDQHGTIVLYISSKEVYCKCGRRMKEVQP